jgi:hypothetical protein
MPIAPLIGGGPIGEVPSADGDMETDAGPASGGGPIGGGPAIGAAAIGEGLIAGDAPPARAAFSSSVRMKSPM